MPGEVLVCIPIASGVYNLGGKGLTQRFLNALSPTAQPLPAQLKQDPQLGPGTSVCYVPRIPMSYVG